MTTFPFDTLSASKRLREAGMAEGVAEAVVSVFQHAYTTPDIGHLATKDDLSRFATRDDLANAVAGLATKDELHALEARLLKQMQTQTWMVVGLMSGVIGLSTTVIKLFP